MTINLTTMPEGKTYQDTYSGYLEVFRRIAEGEEFEVIDPPFCWIPLLRYLGAEVGGGQLFFPLDHMFSEEWSNLIAPSEHVRQLVEIACGARPELVDALWKADMEWHCNRGFGLREEVPITTYNSWYSKEIMGVMKKVRDSNILPLSDKCVLVPCAADKPYPAPMHKKVKEIVGDEFELIVTSGMIGLLPERLWPTCQLKYDAGIPNFWRVMQSVEEYFLSWPEYKKIVVYSDFYVEAIYRGLMSAQAEKTFVFPIGWRKNYQNLMTEENLDRLRTAIAD